jgi:hypothetical protein
LIQTQAKPLTASSEATTPFIATGRPSELQRVVAVLGVYSAEGGCSTYDLP